MGIADFEYVPVQRSFIPIAKCVGHIPCNIPSCLSLHALGIYRAVFLPISLGANRAGVVVRAVQHS